MGTDSCANSCNVPIPSAPFPHSAMAPWPPPALSPFLSITMSPSPWVGAQLGTEMVGSELAKLPLAVPPEESPGRHHEHPQLGPR